MFGRFKKKEKISDENLIELDIEEPVDCLCDFTYNFIGIIKEKKWV